MNNEFDIAIVGMSCRFPGARNVDEFWRNLAAGIESITPLSDEEILESGVPASYLGNPGYVKAAPILDEPGAFDASFFGFSPMEARIMDPQHRILLELAHEALEDAGCDPQRFRGRIGVFTGAAMNTYFASTGVNRRLAKEYIPTLIANDKDFLSTRISYKLNLKGPSITVQTACSTSLVAIHLARQSLLSEETDVALAGAIAVRVPHRAGYFSDAGGVASPDGHVRAFDAKANGTVFGSGGGIIVLKRLADAIAAGDTIHAVIAGSAVNNDGAEKAGYTAPGVDGQADAVVEALANAGTDADSISYVEAHGSGTPVGDPIEIRALTKAFRASTRRSGYCAIGSVKTNVGHLDAAAGIAGVMKTVLALKHRELPPSLNFHEANPEIDFPNTPFYVNTRLRDWASEGPRRAGVMATGMGGTNAHVVLEEAPDAAENADAKPAYLLILSAKTEAALDEATRLLRDFLTGNERVNMSDVAYTLQVGRKAFAHRRCLVCTSREDAIAALGPEASKRVLSGRADESRRPVIFMLPGIGDHYVGMAHDLYEAWPAFKEEVDRCARILEPHLGIDIRTVIYPDSQGWKNKGKSKGIDLKTMLGRRFDAPEDADAANLNRTLFSQPALFTIEYAIARLWQSLGITPDAIVGHSMGEYVAACLAGVLSLEDALRLIATRAKLVDELPRGAMLAIMLPEHELRPLLDEPLSISLINGPSLCVVAGPVAPVRELEKMLTARGVISRHVQNAHAFHSRMLDPILTPFQAEASKVRLNEPRIRYISNVSGKWITAREATDPAYWAMHANHTARFSDALHELWQLENPILVECGPGRTLGVLAMQHPDRARSAEPVALSCVRHHYENESDADILLQSVGKLWLAGADIDWEGHHAGEKRRRVSLPTYPFERRDYWMAASPDSSTQAQGEDEPSGHRPLDDWFYVPTWERTPFPSQTRDKPRAEGTSWLIVADRHGRGAAVKAKLERLGFEAEFVRFGARFARRSDGAFELNPAGVDDYLQLFKALQGKLAKSINIVHLGGLTGDAPATTPPSPRFSNQDLGFHSLMHIAQAIGEFNVVLPIRIGVISNRVHAVTGDEVLDPEMATVLGPCGVIPKEFPNVTCFNIDLPDERSIDDLPDATLTRIISEFSATHKRGVVAYRGPYRWERGYEQVRLPGPAAPDVANAALESKRLRRGGVYLITGGTGGLGLVIAKHLAAACQPRIVLTKKTVFPAKSTWRTLAASAGTSAPVRRTIEALLELEDLGAEVEVVVADSAHAEQMRAALNQAIARFGAIHGVIHAAGIVRAGLIQAKTRQTAQSVLAPKVEGTKILFDLVKDAELDFLVLFSSITSVLTPYAESDYSAANAFLDAFGCFANAARPFRTVTINWPGWKEVGQLADLKSLPGVEGWKETALEKAIATEEGLEVFKRVLESDLDQVVVSPENLARLLEQSQAPFDPAEYLREAKNRKETRPRQKSPATAADQPIQEIEAQLAEIWSDVFGLEAIGIHDDFARLGGHSLIAMQIASRIRSAYPIRFTLRDLFEAPTIARLSELVQARILGEIGGAAAEEPIRALPRADRRALSSSERLLWFFDQLEPGSSAYNVAFQLAFDGELHVDALERSLAAVVARHDALRTRYQDEDGEPYAIMDPPRPCALRLVETGGEDREREAALLIELDAEQPFDLAAGPLWRALLVRISANRLLLGITLHHIVADGWSVGIFTRELLAAYEALAKGPEPGLPTLALQYADFAAWESEWIRTDAALRQLDYWRERLSGVRVMDLPADFPRPRVQTFRGGSCSGQLSAELNRRLGEFSRAHGATPFMALLAAFGLLLHRLSGLDDVPLGVAVAGRGRSGTDKLIGMFVNTIVARQDHSGDPSFAELLKRTRTQALEGYANAEAPFDHVVDAVRAPRDAGRTPLFQVLVNTLDFQAKSRFSLPSVEVEARITEMAASKFDMTLYLGLEENTTGLMLTYNADLFTAARMEELLAQFEGVLGQVLRDPEKRVSQLSLLTPASAAVLPDPTRSLGDQVLESVPAALAPRLTQAAPRVALTGQGESWTHAALEAQANRLAHQLLRGGLQRQDVVAIYAHREPLMACAMLGILKAGGAFAILDPTYPQARLAACWRAAQPRAAILLDGAGEPPAALQVEMAELAPELRIHLSAATASAATAQLASSALPSHDPALPIRRDELAYVAFTSGTTGGVKAILGAHGPVVHFLDWQARAFALGRDDRFAMLSGLSHDPLLRDVLAPLWVGGSLHVPDPGRIAEPGWLGEWIAREKLTVLHLTPAMAQLVTAVPDQRIESLRWIFIGGDVLTSTVVDLLRRAAPNATCVNFYGTTETPQVMGYYVVPSSGGTMARVPVGRGIDDVQLLVLNARDALAGVGELGEIVVRTPYLALGYRGDDKLTRERFRASPFSSDPRDRVYRTGDLGRYLPDGNVELCGRGDGQTKLRGFRLELGEIEAVLAEHPEVRQAAVHLWRVNADDVRIVACCVPMKAGVLAPISLRKHMRARLPEYMVPQYFVPLEEIPLTPNGKIDRGKLPAPAASEGNLQRHEPPADPVEAAIAEVWTHLIGPTRPIGRADKFFEMGGHSLLALRALRQMERQLGVKLDLRVLFHESLAEIATRCRSRRIAHA